MDDWILELYWCCIGFPREDGWLLFDARADVMVPVVLCIFCSVTSIGNLVKAYVRVIYTGDIYGLSKPS
jgi:hypothetical protein